MSGNGAGIGMMATFAAAVGLTIHRFAVSPIAATGIHRVVTTLSVSASPAVRGSSSGLSYEPDQAVVIV